MTFAQRNISLQDAPTALDGHVIIGGGVCGCLLAHQLATRSNQPVWIIEAGGEQAENQSYRDRPARWLHLLGSSDDYAFSTLPNDALSGRQITWPRGRGLGGSGRINAMIWLPPHSSDLQTLTDAGLDRSSLNNALETSQTLIPTEAPRFVSESSQHFLDSVQHDSNLGTFAAYQRINRFGRRWTTARLLDDLDQTSPESTARVRVIQANVNELSIRENQVDAIQLQSGRLVRDLAISADTQVVSCAGALGTPELIMRSGIRHPAIGANLHDHLIMPIIYRHSGSGFLAGRPNMNQLAAWQHGGTGPLASNIAECGGFDPSMRFQLHVTPTDYLRYPARAGDPAMTFAVSLTRPQSRGRLTLSEADANTPAQRLQIDTGYLSDRNDVGELIEAVRWGRQLAESLQQSGWLLKESTPGVKRQSDSQLEAAIARFTQTLYHPGGSCSLGTVVDANFRACGLENLRIVDASLLPEPTFGNPTGVLAMLTCYAAQAIAGKQK
ncbi:GMC family oxidoreductase [Neorhodopirellula lusitana]|uniref:GMC family oxidoreductase n=1 Tax=Neorhodopirellula lusitana TaxID=445327 RepID=UPI00384DDB54